MANGRYPERSDINEIIARFKEMFLDGEVEQLRGKFVADDDGLWFFRRASKSNRVQAESSYGKCPFVIEHDDDTRSFEAGTIDEAVELLALLLGGNTPTGLVVPWTGPRPLRS